MPSNIFVCVLLSGSVIVPFRVADGESLQLSFLLFLAVCRQISMRKGEITQRCKTHRARTRKSSVGKHRGRREIERGRESEGQLQSCVHNSASAPQGAVTLQMGQIISMFPQLQSEAYAVSLSHTHMPNTP